MAKNKLFSDEDKTVLFEGMELSDEGQTDFLIKLETVIVEKVAEKEVELIEANETTLEEAKGEMVSEMEDNINSYLDYVVETWAEENKLALESGIKLEIMENFMSGMKDLFAESYIDIPEEQADLVVESQNKIDQLESDLATQIDKVGELKEAVEDLQRTKIISEHSVGLTDTQVEKFETLLEGVEYGSDSIFQKKAKTIRESYFKTDTTDQPLREEVIAEDDKTDNKDPMAKYLAHL